jgi:lysyl-tRNA synthetase class 2
VTDFRPSATLESLRRRAQLLAAVRAFFAEQGFWEVETPLLSADTVVDRFLEPIPVADPCSTPSGASPTYWLQTSPEFGMKRLLAAGAEAIYQVSRAFRREECGRLHNPEFTLVEWYRVGDGLERGMQRLAALCEQLLGLGPPDRLSYREAFERSLGLNPHRAAPAALQRAATERGLSVHASFCQADRDEWLNLLMAEVVQPQLGQSRPVIVFDYPASQAALARVRWGDDPVAERFELYVGGMELANGYHELLDPAVLAERQRLANQQRLAEGRCRLPEQNRLLAAMEHGLPACCGVALGFDRLVMAALKATSLREVIAFPFDIA